MTYATLVDPATLHAHLDDPNWIVIDCRHTLADFSLGRKMYEEGHIAGAFFADVEHDLAGEQTGTNGRHPLPDPEHFAQFLRALGANGDSQIVAYDAGGDMFAARLWFLCKWIGHDRVAVLDGGLTAWRAAGYDVSADPPAATALGTLPVRLNDALVVTADEVLRNLERADMQLLDARGADRFAGQNETIDPVAGHIPGAQNRPFKQNFSDDLRLRSAAELRAAFEPFGEPARIVHQCGSGVSGAANMLAMEAAGLHGSRLYAGSWSEWIADPSRPIVGAATEGS